jgi:serine/threonine-protein kinase
MQGTRKSDETGRAYLQTRLGLYAKLVLLSIAADLTLLTITYRIHPEIKPRNADAITMAGVCGLAVLVILWRVMARYTLSRAWLYRMDLFMASSIGCFLAAGAYFADDLRPASYTAVVLAYGLVFTRALVVPTGGTRTAITTTLTFIPLMASAIGLSIIREQEVPRDTFIGGAFVFAVVAVILVTTGSQIIYGLRQKYSEAMQLGQYTIDRPIGEGGMGAVYRAQHALLRRPTAIKLLRPDRVGAENLERFEREVQHMSQLTHPNTVAVFDYGHNQDGVFYYAMEYLDGINLEQLVAKYGAQPPARVSSVLAQVCSALTEAHGRGLIHRDIKPANIILCERGGMPDVAKVVDFGLVKELTASTGSSTQVILGTPAYLAPEAVTDPTTVGPPVDIYALGAVGYFLLTGKRVFNGNTVVDLCVQHVTAAPQPLPDTVPPELAALIMRCLAKAPGDRPTARQLLRALAPASPETGWSEEDARGWWGEFRKKTPEPAPAPTGNTLTITVDITRWSPRDTKEAG